MPNARHTDTGETNVFIFFSSLLLIDCFNNSIAKFCEAVINILSAFGGTVYADGGAVGVWIGPGAGAGVANGIRSGADVGSDPGDEDADFK